MSNTYQIKKKRIVHLLRLFYKFHRVIAIKPIIDNAFT